MKNFDYRGLEGTAKRSSYYVRPNSSDEVLKGVVGYGAVFAVLFSFGLAVLMSYLGHAMSLDDVARPVGSTVLVSVPLLLCAFFLGGAPIIGRSAMIGVAGLTVLVLLIVARPDQLSTWYLFAPLFVFTFVVATLAIWQLTKFEANEEVAP